MQADSDRRDQKELRRRAEHLVQRRTRRCIGGLRIQVGSDLYDGSVKTRLEKLDTKVFERNFMSNLLQEIEAQIAGAKTATAKQNVGIVREIGDGVAKIEGLTDAMLNEMLDFGNGVIGLALNLEETEVGAIILGDYTGIKEGQEVRTTGKLLPVPVGKGLLGRVVNTLGQPVDGKGPIKETAFYPVEKIAPGIIKRKSVSQPVQTGIMAIDAMIPIGRGQRELIIGDRSTGKTTIGVDTMINQARINKAAEAAGDKDFRPLYTIYVAIGQKQSNVARVIAVLEEAGAMPYTIVVVAAGLRFRHEPVSRAVRRRGDGRMVHGQRHGRADHLRRSLQARRRLPPGVADPEAPVRPRSVSGRRVLSAQPPARTQRARVARNTATARSPRCRSSRRRRATFRPTFRRT